MEELMDAFVGTERWKCKHEAGMVAEMLKQDRRTLHESMLELFNDVLKPDAQPPTSWGRTTLVILLH